MVFYNFGLFFHQYLPKSLYIYSQFIEIMDDKLYILAVIAWVAYSFYKAYNKSRKKHEVIPPVVVQPEIIRNQPETRQFENPFNQKYEQTDFNPVNYPEFEQYSIPDDSIEELSSVENLTIEKMHQASEKFSKEAHLTETNTHVPNVFATEITDIDLRKAIIYAEILNRKY